MYRLAFVCLLVAGCSRGGGEPARQPDGGYRLACRGPLSDCLVRAEQLCREQGYTVAAARDTRELLGHEQGQSQIEVRKSEATIYCGASAPPAERAIDDAKREPPAQPAPPPPPAAPSPSPDRACVPGATPACVGPAGCPGGQSCATDGTHFEACDCGPRN